MTLPQKPYRFMYLDVEGIDSLNAQTVTRFETESTSSRGRGRKSRISGSVGLGNAIGSFFGLLNLKGEAGSESSVTSNDTVKSHLATEQKLREILEYLSRLGEPTLFVDLAHASDFSEDNKDAVFLHLQTEFDVPQFYGDAGVQAVNQAQYVVFEKDTENSRYYDYRDDYFRKRGIPIVMSASLSKFPNCKGQMGMTGHDAIFIRGHAGRQIPLHVFGSLFKLTAFCQIKPYAIWP